MADFLMTPMRRKGSNRGGRNGHLYERREQIARELIPDITPTIGDHTACDPEHPESLCAECAELLVTPATPEDWDDFRDGRLG